MIADWQCLLAKVAEYTDVCFALWANPQNNHQLCENLGNCFGLMSAVVMLGARAER